MFLHASYSISLFCFQTDDLEGYGHILFLRVMTQHFLNMRKLCISSMMLDVLGYGHICPQHINNVGANAKHIIAMLHNLSSTP